MELSSSRGLKTKHKITWNVALLPKGIYVERWQERNNNIFEFSENSDFQQKSLVTHKKMDDGCYLKFKCNLSESVISLEIYLSLASKTYFCLSIQYLINTIIIELSAPKGHREVALIQVKWITS